MHIIVVERKTHFRYRNPGCLVLNNREFITRPELVLDKRAKIINLSNDYSYLGYGYYCSLLAEARSQKVIPSVKTILDLRQRSIYSHALPELDELLRQQVKKLVMLPTAPFTMHVFFGRTDDLRFPDLARRVFDEFRCPMLKLSVSPEDGWHIASIRPMALSDLKPEQESFFEHTLESYTRSSWRTPKAKPAAKYSLAILHNPSEALPPSDRRTLQKFVRIGEQMGVEVELVEKKDYAELAEYDALFIRETTALDHHTYRFAKKAENEGMAVIDDPTSILRCTNKVYLAELLKANKIPTPKTVVLDNRGVDAIDQEIPYPIILKIPDGSFSRGIVKAENREQLEEAATRLLRESDVILAQEYLYTDFDWRIGILRGQPIYACQYFMSRGHWQVVKHGDGGRFTEGGFRTLPVEAAPPEVVDIALKAAGLIGNGFYGVDLKQTPKGVVVIEVNDNPSINQGEEDAVLKDELYRRIIQEFIRRLEERPGSSDQTSAGLQAVAAGFSLPVNGNGSPPSPAQIAAQVAAKVASEISAKVAAEVSSQVIAAVLGNARPHAVPAEDPADAPPLPLTFTQK
ncbi:RimK-like ATPgrasp N-terminal domain-containing protein [Ferrovibrio terrae]|jgi:glutathione synthase/RimK-type ligase-like ATP-grasp enzyme|uniref:RimK family protein n=1 Tax=Ferrovibrio terrae TaxID=2594003 RepID=UPI003138271E